MVEIASLTDAVLDARIEAAYPQIDFAKLVVIDRGFGSIVFGVPPEVIVRVPRTAVVAAAHRHERDLLARIADRVLVAVPTVSWVASPEPRIPWGASAYRWIDGSQPVVPVSAGAALVNDLAVFMATLHHIPLSLLGGTGLPSPRDLARTRAEDAAMIEPVLRARLSPREFARLEARLAAILADPILDDFTPALRHGDLWFGNVLVDEQSAQLNAVLDWEHAAIGDPAEDLATQRYLGDDATRAVTEHYLQRVGGLDGAQLLQRSDLHFALREVSGIRRCVEMRDDEELEDELRKLRSGPLLA